MSQPFPQAAPPRVSVIMPCYKHEALLTQAIESVMAQRAPFAYELIVGEDCSPDGSAELLKELAARYPDRIRLFLREKNMGSGENFQDLMRYARGEFLAVLEGDDYWVREDKLARQVELMDRKPHLSGCFSWAVKIGHPGGDVVGRWGPKELGEEFNLEFLVEYPCVPTCTLLYRREALAGYLNTPKDIICQDFMLFSETAKLGPLGFIDDELAHYRVHQGGIWSSRSEIPRVRETIRTCTFVASTLSGAPRRAIERQMGVLYYHLCWLMELDGDRSAARQALAQAVRRFPFEQKVGLSHLAGTVVRLYLPIIGRVAGRVGALARARSSA